MTPHSAKPELPEIKDDQTVFVSDTGQLRWDVSEKDKGYFTVSAPRTKLFTGFVAGRTFDLGNVKLRIGHTRLDWATISMTRLDEGGFASPGRILIAATGYIQNTGRTPDTVSEDMITYGRDWGKPPILCEGIPMQIASPQRRQDGQRLPAG